MLFSVCFHCIVFRKMPGQLQKYQVLVTFAGFSPQYGKRYKHAGTSSIFSNWRKEALLHL